jgi:hypothetical protein
MRTGAPTKEFLRAQELVAAFIDNALSDKDLDVVAFGAWLLTAACELHCAIAKDDDEAARRMILKVVELFFSDPTRKENLQ